HYTLTHTLSHTHTHTPFLSLFLSHTHTHSLSFSLSLPTSLATGSRRGWDELRINSRRPPTRWFYFSARTLMLTINSNNALSETELRLWPTCNCCLDTPINILCPGCPQIKHLICLNISVIYYLTESL